MESTDLTRIFAVVTVLTLIIYADPGTAGSGPAGAAEDTALVNLPVEEIADEFKKVRKIKGHFDGGAWNDEVDKWMGRKHRLMIKLGLRLAGGKDCSLYTSGTLAHQGANAANIQDNSGVSSSFYYTNGVDVDTPGYIQIKVEFWFTTLKIESGEDFWVQYYDGSTWHTVATYVCGADFNNGELYNKTLNIDEANYVFPADMKIRFMCDASDNRDDVYIDEIRVSAK